MRKAVFWKTDRFFGVLASVVLFEVSGNGLINSLTCKAYEFCQSADEVAQDLLGCIGDVGAQLDDSNGQMDIDIHR